MARPTDRVAGAAALAARGAVLALAIGLGACTVEPISLEGRACPCAPGWACDRGVCVRPSTVDASRDASHVDAGTDAAGTDAASADGGSADGGSVDAATGVDAGMDAGPPDAGPRIVSVRVASSTDDAEECLEATSGADPAGSMYIGSTDLELTNDPGGAYCVGAQLVGMRFASVAIPRDASIVEAHLELVVDEPSSEATSLVLSAEASDEAARFTTATSDLSSRPRGTVRVAWSDIAPWDTAGVVVRTPDVGPLIREVVARPGWAEGNALVLIVEGTGRRIAVAYDREPASAPRLHVLLGD